MSVPPTLIAVMQMLSVVTLMDLTLAHVKLDTLEMAKVVLVSSLMTKASRDVSLVTINSKESACLLSTMLLRSKNIWNKPEHH